MRTKSIAAAPLTDDELEEIRKDIHPRSEVGRLFATIDALREKVASNSEPIAAYREVTNELNLLAETSERLPAYASGARTIPSNGPSLIAERVRLAIAIADNASRVSFRGWAK